MTEKEFIETLNRNNSDYSNPELAITTANFCNTISRDINTDSQRFIYELLQNADDASNQNKKLDVQIDFIEDFLIVSHKGEPFSRIDVESISSAGDGTKTSDANKTGFKGIGFKSVFSHSNYVIIKSKEFCFRYDKSCWKDHWKDSWGSKDTWQNERRIKQKNDQSQMPWQIIPVWTELSEEFNQSLISQQFNVSTIIKCNEIERLKKDIVDLFSNTQILLFLRSKEVSVVVNGSGGQLTIVKSNNGETTTLTRNGILQSKWIIKTEQISIPLDVQEKINADEKSPKKLKDASHTEISFAIKVEDGELKSVSKENSLIFTYLPTSINYYGFPFLVNASFLTDAGRQHLHQDIFWNNWLFKQIPLKFFSWVAELAHKNSKYSNQFLKIVPHKLNGTSELEQSFNKGYQQAIATIAFVPNQDGCLQKVSESIFDKTSISDVINKQILVNHINQKLSRSFTIDSLVKHLEPISVLVRLGIEIFEIDDLDSLFASTTFISEHQVSENFDLIKFVFEKSNHSNDAEEWNQKLKNTPFIFNQNLKLCKPINLVFGTYSRVSEEEVFHNFILSEVRNNREIYNWLIKLGVQEPTDTAFVNLIVQQPENFIDLSNAIEVIRFLFNMYKNNCITNLQFEELRKVKLLTQEGILLSSERCYLPDFYEPNLRLEKIYPVNIYVSDKYIEGKDDKVEWKAFFLKINVKERIGAYQLNSLTIQSLSHSFGTEYFNLNNDCIFNFPQGSFGHGSHNQLSFLRSLSFLEYTSNNLFFAKIFWNNVILTQALELEYLCEPPVLFYGSGAGHNRFQTSIKLTYFQWFVFNNDCIPTTQDKCHKPKFVYLNVTEIKEIAGKYLPVFDCDFILSPELRDFFGFKDSLSLDNYLNILQSIANDLELSEEEQQENQKRIGLIYDKLASMNLHNSEKELISAWGKENKLLSKNGRDFFHSKDISIVTVDGFKASNLAYINSLASENINLLRLFGVVIIDKIIPSISQDSTENKTLKDKLINISSLTALISVEKSKNYENWELEYKRINNKLKNIHFYQSSEIYLSYGNEDDKQKRSSWVDANNFYYVGNCSSPRVLDGLVEPLCKFLGIRYAERLLIVLLLEGFVDSVEYLKEKGYDIMLIPDNILNAAESETSVDMQRSTIDNINNENRSYNLEDENIGREGEKFVYKRLQEIYVQKYNCHIQETKTGFKLSGVQKNDIGSKKLNTVEVFWLNKNENTTANHDFRIRENGKEIYLDSKATPHSENKKVPFYVSSNELDLMRTVDKYLIARVFNIQTNPVMELIKLDIDDLN